MATFLVQKVRNRITCTERSKINCPLDQKRTLEALGLRKMGQVVEHDANPSILGMVSKVKHLVSVEETK